MAKCFTADETVNYGGGGGAVLSAQSLVKRKREVRGGKADIEQP